MSKSEKFWDQSASNYDNTEEKFEFIHSHSRENTKRYLKDTHSLSDKPAFC
jgi:hypothetical protein